MKWMRERDLLIAQTMAFVQSVTGKAPEAEKTVTASVALLSVETSETTRTAAALPGIESLLAETPPATQAPSREPSSDVSREMPREISRPAPLARLDLQEDFQSGFRSWSGKPGWRSSVRFRSCSNIAARPWPRSTLPSGKASRRRGRRSRPETQNRVSQHPHDVQIQFRARRRPAPCWPRRRPAGRRSA